MVMIHQIIKIIREIFSRGIFVYCIMAVLFVWLFDFPQTMYIVKAKTLNRLRPSPLYMAGLIEGRETYDKEKLSSYLSYYHKVLEVVPYRADVHAMLGYCYYKMGSYHKALKYYHKAVFLEPQIFWFNYNLAVLYLKQQDYDRAREFFELALTSSQAKSLEYVHSSRIFRYILLGSKIPAGRAIGNRLEKDTQNAFIGLNICYQRLNYYPQMLDTSRYAISQDVGYLSIFNFYVGLANFHMQQFDVAVVSFRKSLQLNEHNVESLHHLGLTLLVLGKRDVALQLIKRAEVLRQINGSIIPTENDFELRIF